MQQLTNPPPPGGNDPKRDSAATTFTGYGGANLSEGQQTPAAPSVRSNTGLSLGSLGSPQLPPPPPETFYVIDCEPDPFVPRWCTRVEEHNHVEPFKFSLINLPLSVYSAPFDKPITGDALRRKFAPLRLPNANILDYLLAHPTLIPDDWSDKKVFFWGTIYRDWLGLRVVRYLFRLHGSWTWKSMRVGRRREPKDWGVTAVRHD
jgi:hypothetical protein